MPSSKTAMKKPAAASPGSFGSANAVMKKSAVRKKPAAAVSPAMVSPGRGRGAKEKNAAVATAILEAAAPAVPKPQKLVDRVPVSADGQWVLLKKEETWWNNCIGKIHVNTYETTYIGAKGGQWALRDWQERWQQVQPPPSASK